MVLSSGKWLKAALIMLETESFFLHKSNASINEFLANVA